MGVVLSSLRPSMTCAVELGIHAPERGVQICDTGGNAGRRVQYLAKRKKRLGHAVGGL